jgi:sulfur-oxidizing protein SoxY
VTHIPRRTFLKGTVALSVAGLAATAGVLRAPTVLAAEYPTNAFVAKKIDDALKALYGSSQVANSDAIKVKAPPVAENGAVVPITVDTTLANVESIAILVDNNPMPLVTAVNMSGADSYFSTFIKMAKTSDVHIVVKAGGKLYGAKATIKVTAGGCGG